MKISPLIHSRTRYCGFNSNFAVRPENLDVQWAMKKILPAISDGIAETARYVVAEKSSNCKIAGIAVVLRDFFKTFSIDEKENEKFLVDERGRDIKLFLGYVVEDYSENEIPIVSAEDLWKMFIDNLTSEWDRKSSITQYVGYQEWKKTKTITENSLPPAVDVGEIKIFSDAEDRKIFEWCLAKGKDFCSNVDSTRIVENGQYQFIIATKEIINTLREKENVVAKKKSVAITTKTAPTSTQSKINIQTQNIPKTAEKDLTQLVAVAAVIVIILIIAFFNC